MSTQHGAYEFLRPWQRQLDRWTSYLADCIVAVSEATRQWAIQNEGIVPHRVVTLRNGIDLEPFLRVKRAMARLRIREEFHIPVDTLVLSVVARLGRGKGISVLLDALGGSGLTGQSWHLLLVGEGHERDSLTQRVAGSHLAGRVTFTGTRQDIPEILAATDVFVLPSFNEGLSLAVCEAMAMGLPVVASDVGGMKELVVDGVTGRLVPPGDADALHAALLQSIMAPELRQRWGKAGRRRAVSEFSLERMMQELQDVYCSLLAKKRRN